MIVDKVSVTSQNFYHTFLFIFIFCLIYHLVNAFYEHHQWLLWCKNIIIRTYEQVLNSERCMKFCVNEVRHVTITFFILIILIFFREKILFWKNRLSVSDKPHFKPSIFLNGRFIATLVTHILCANYRVA